MDVLHVLMSFRVEMIRSESGTRHTSVPRVRATVWPLVLRHPSEAMQEDVACSGTQSTFTSSER